MRLNEDVVRGLLYNSMRLENSISQNLMKLFMTEEDQKRRKMLYDFIRDTHYHRFLLIDCLRLFGGSSSGDVQEDRFSNVFDDMFTLQKMAILRDILTTMQDFYSFFLEDIEKKGLNESIDSSRAEKLRSTVATLYAEKRKQVEKLGAFGEVY